MCILRRIWQAASSILGGLYTHAAPTSVRRFPCMSGLPPSSLEQIHPHFRPSSSLESASREKNTSLQSVLDYRCSSPQCASLQCASLQFASLQFASLSVSAYSVPVYTVCWPCRTSSPRTNLYGGCIVPFHAQSFPD